MVWLHLKRLVRARRAEPCTNSPSWESTASWRDEIFQKLSEERFQVPRKEPFLSTPTHSLASAWSHEPLPHSKSDQDSKLWAISVGTQKLKASLGMEKFMDVCEVLARPEWLIYCEGRAWGCHTLLKLGERYYFHAVGPGEKARQQKVSVLQRAEVVNSLQERPMALLGHQRNKLSKDELLNETASVHFLHLDKGEVYFGYASITAVYKP